MIFMLSEGVGEARSYSVIRLKSICTQLRSQIILTPLYAIVFIRLERRLELEINCSYSTG